jgi:hypothetical protein
MTGARQFGKLLKANWGKDAWTHLSTDAQWLYAYLVSQPTTDTAGVFQIRISKWSKGSPDMTKERVAAAAKMLVDRGWIAVDHDTEEGLLRNYMRDDWAGKLIFKGALARALLVQSMPLRAVLLSEIRELKCERPIVEDDQLSLIADLEQSVPPDFDVASVVGFLRPSPPPSPKPSPQAFEGRTNGVQTPSVRRSQTSAQQRGGNDR